MGILSVVLFFLYTWGFGFTLGKIAKDPENFFEKNLSRIALGLVAVPLFGLVLSVAKIPVDWRIFLAASVICPLYSLVRNYKNLRISHDFKLKKSDLSFLLAVIVFLLSFYMYYKGSLAYPYLEDDDSWSHAIGVKYVSVQKTFFNPGGGIHYLDPYPPFYDGFLGLLQQTSPSLIWTLKFFNAIVISLSILFFYLFVRELTDNSGIALFSAIALAMVPAYLSHFIWAHAFIPCFIFISFYFLERTKHDRHWAFFAGISIAAVILTTITHSLKFMFLFFIYFAVRCFVEKKFIWEIFASAVLGFLISLLWWAPLSARYGSVSKLFKNLGLAQDVSSLPLHYLDSFYFYLALSVVVLTAVAIAYSLRKKISEKQKSLIGIGTAVLLLVLYVLAYSSINGVGTADRIYDFNDFFVAKKQNMINNPVGLGMAIFILFYITMVFVINEELSVIRQNKNHLQSRFYPLYSSAVLGGSLFLASSISFFLFRFRQGTFIKQWMLRIPENYNYVYSFSFKVWGVYLLTASLAVIALVYALLIYKGFIEKQKLWIPLSLFWFVYSFAGLFDIPTQMFTFRIWAMLAFVLCIFIGYGFVSMTNLAKRIGVPKITIWIVVVISIFYTSGIQKYAVNTAVWPPGGFWTSGEELNGYMWLKDNLPAETRVFTFSNNGIIIGLDKFICHWCSEVSEYQRTGFSQTTEHNYNWLRREGYRYIVIDGQTARKFGANETGIKLQEMAASGFFKPVHQTSGFILFSVM